MPRYALTLAYDGSGLPGWQTQPSGQAVQDRLERALAAVAGHPVATICAGRTDAGVHALRQVVHFDSDARRPDSAWVRGVNAHLPAAIAVRTVTRVSDDFHARYGASRRRYRYLLYSSPVRHPLLAGRSGWTFRELDDARMREAAALLAGEHDFSAFRSSECQAASPVRRLEPIAIRRHGPLLLFDFAGNAFLHHMIRNLMGSLLMIGDWPTILMSCVTASVGVIFLSMVQSMTGVIQGLGRQIDRERDQQQQQAARHQGAQYRKQPVGPCAGGRQLAPLHHMQAVDQRCALRHRHPPCRWSARSSSCPAAAWWQTGCPLWL